MGAQKNRNVDRIHEVIQRGQRHIFFVDFLINGVEAEWKEAKGKGISIGDYVVIRLVTILETHLRRVVQKIVDHGDPYRSNSLRLIKGWSAESLADALPDVKDNRITLGQIVAYGISVNDIDAILSNLKSIFGENLPQELAESGTRWIEDNAVEENSKPLIKDYGKTIATIGKMLRVRHILVHEMPETKPYTENDIPEFLSHTGQFGEALDWVVVGKSFGKVPRFQSTMNRMASEDAKKAQSELDRLRGGTSKDFESLKSLSDKVEYHWDKFCEFSAEKRAEENKGGSIYPLIYANEKERLLLWRISDIVRSDEQKKRRLS